MKSMIVVALVVCALGVLSAPAAGAVPTRLTLTAPSSVSLGEEISLEARLVTDDGEPVAGARLELRQVGAVGERMMGEATTDDEGRASFVHREYSVAALALRVAFPGSASQMASHADTLVSIDGLQPEPAVVMSHTAGRPVKEILFLVLGSVWLTYLYAASRIARVALDRDRGGDRRKPFLPKQARRTLEGGRSR